MIDSSTTTTITTTDHMPRKGNVGDDDNEQQDDGIEDAEVLFAEMCKRGSSGVAAPAFFGSSFSLWQDECVTGDLVVTLNELRVVNRLRFLRDDGHSMAVEEGDDRHQKAHGPDPATSRTGWKWLMIRISCCFSGIGGGG